MTVTAAMMLLTASVILAQQPALDERFRHELESLHARYGFPGATAACILPDGTTFVAAAGLADTESGTPMTPESRMLAASIGKTFAGATLLALVHEAAADLDSPVSTWLGDRPWFSRLPNHGTITLRHLLTHTSGIGNHVETPGFIEAFRKNRGVDAAPLAPEDMIAFVLDVPPMFAAGQGWHYSDTNYLLAGLVIEEITGHDYYDEVRRRFIAPLGLIHTSPSDSTWIEGLASGYVSPDNPFGLPPKTTVDPGVMCWNPGVEWTGGGLVSTPRDLVVWARALFEGSAMAGDYLPDLLDAVPTGDGTDDTRYGIAVAVHTGPHGTSYGHNGWIPGYCSSLRYYPGHGIAVAFQINTDIGIADGTSRVFEDMQERLADVVMAAVEGP